MNEQNRKKLRRPSLSKTLGEGLQHNEQQVKKEFHRRWQIVMGSLIPAILVGGCAVYTNTPTLSGLVFPLIAFYVVICLLYWRCPVCNTYLGRNAFPRSCHKCKSPLF